MKGVCMRRIFGVVGVLFLLMTGGTAFSAEKEKGPEFNVPEGQFEKEVADEEGLQRGGNFGKLHLFGYGEMHYNSFIGATPNQLDFHRMVLGVAYDFTDWVKFRSEVDFEHAFKEPELEFATVDFLLHPWLNARVGSVLVPVGVLNQHHEPPLFYSVERPEVYRLIIPTTWQEGGAGIFGKLPADFDYELYGLSSLTAADPTASNAEQRGFSGSEGIRGGRKTLGETNVKNFAAVGRLQYKGLPGLRVGSSFFLGNTGQGNVTIGGALLSMVEGDAKYSFEGIDLEGLVAFSHLGDAGNINKVFLAATPTFTDFVGSEQLGWYVEGAYHLFHHLLPQITHDVVAFTRFEDINTQQKMPTGFAADPANDRKVVTVGVSYLPIPQVALKADYMFKWNKANADVDQLNFGIGFYY